MSLIIHEPRQFQSCLPREYYTSPEIFQQEVEKIFHRSWHYVGHPSQVREPGDYIVTRAANESLIVTRDKSGTLRAYFNVCRHRGSQICDELSSGKAKQFVCPYHRWSFDLDGKLLGAPGSPNGVEFNYADYPLHEAYCEEARSCIFVWIGKEEPTPLSDFLGTDLDEERFARAEAHKTKLAAERRYIIKGNWKSKFENDLECYHCAGGHTALPKSCDYTTFYLDRTDDNQLVQDNVGWGDFPLRSKMKTFSIDGEWVSRKRLGTLPEGGSAQWVTLLPFTGHVWYADHGVAGFGNALSVDTTEYVFQWFVHEDAVEGEDYEVDKLIAIWDITNREDVELIERSARGELSSRFVPGPGVQTREPWIADAYDIYRELLES